jgi:hypothetical protein
MAMNRNERRREMSPMMTIQSVGWKQSVDWKKNVD